MKTEAQRIAIAEACGRKCPTCNNTSVRTKLGVEQYHWARNSNDVWRNTWPVDEPDLPCDHSDLPDYPSDLYAAVTLCDHLAEKGWNCELSQGTDKTWECTFERIASKDSPVGTLTFDNDTAYEIYYHPADTLPEAICGAFLRTIGRWVEE
jgi:hypothetical protein